MARNLFSSAAATVLALLSSAVVAAAPQSKIPVPLIDQSAVGQRGFFYVPGSYVGAPSGTVMQGQMYVEVIAPKRILKPYPLVLIHGSAQTGTNFMGTPDGRKGWADRFVELGYVVYVVDQPMRGRSAWHPEDGSTRMFTTEELQRLFTATNTMGNWSQAKKHTQWPGTGRPGDPTFDAFYSSQVETLTSSEKTERAAQQAGAALLDLIGPAVLVTHSQATAFAWLIADSRPQLVKANVALEPAGPPIEGVLFAPGKRFGWGLTNAPLTYNPPAATSAEISTVQDSNPEGPDLARCWRQEEPARKLVNLTKIPTVVVVGEASFHAVFDHCTAAWLNQAGVHADLLKLSDHGIHGNGHMMMLEKNNLEIADLLDTWISTNVR